MPFLLYDRRRRSVELKERSSILALWIWKIFFDSVPREVIRWAMRKLGVKEWFRFRFQMGQGAYFIAP